MTLIAQTSRILFAVALVAFGIQHLVYGEFVTRVVPKLPTWVPWHSFWAYLTGCALIVAGAAILLRKGAQVAAATLGAGILLSFVVFYLAQIAAAPVLGGVWTNAGKALALAGGAFLVAASLACEEPVPPKAYFSWLIPLSCVFLSAFLILAGVQHFLFVAFVATLVPSWIPGHIFWTYFAGVALIAGGIGIIIPMTRQLAALLSGTMILLWVVLLHIPRAVAAPHDSNETTAVFEAIAFSATAFLAAVTRAR
jgi:uncharacterized membrane protein